MNHQRNDIQAVIFDMGRVLVDIDNRLLVDKLFKGFSADDIQELGRRTMSDPAMIEFNTGRIEAKEFHRRMSQSYGLEPDFETFKTLWCEIFVTMDGMESMIRCLSKQVTVGVLSDTDPIHWRHITVTWPWIGAIANPTLSYEVGVMKPNPKIYLTASSNIQTPPEHCLYIDDLQANVDGARAAGMKALRFEGIKKLKQDLARYGIPDIPD